MHGLDCTGLGLGPLTGSFEHYADTEYSDPIKRGEFLDQADEYQLL